VRVNRALWLFVILLAPAELQAQRRIVHDTLSMDSPAGVSCGFCGTERFGVVFRELEAPRRGLNPSDFPIVLESVEVVLAAAYGSTCTPTGAGGTVIAPVEIYVGDTIPTGDISDMPDFEWPGETLVWAAEAPIELSAGNGAGMFEFMFNVLLVRDEEEMPITLESGSYLRVVVTMPEGAVGSSPQCEPTYPPVGAAGVRDDDGRIADERSFVWGLGGVGWFWNEDPPTGIPAIAGDWGVRVSYFAMGTGDADAGMTIDAGRALDAGATDDAGAAMDGGMPDAGRVEPGGGCACRPSPGSTAIPGALIVLVISLALLAQRKRS
jgi:hypothetical protein